MLFRSVHIKKQNPARPCHQNLLVIIPCDPVSLARNLPHERQLPVVEFIETYVQGKPQPSRWIDQQVVHIKMGIPYELRQIQHHSEFIKLGMIGKNLPVVGIGEQLSVTVSQLETNGPRGLKGKLVNPVVVVG